MSSDAFSSNYREPYSSSCSTLGQRDHGVATDEDLEMARLTTPTPTQKDRSTLKVEQRHSHGLGVRQTQVARPHFLLNWWQELGACVVSLGALIALFATLHHYADKPSPSWPDWISINTIVAIYIVLLKTSILLVAAEGLSQLKWTWFSNDRTLQDIVTFDNASRGPAGAFALLWKVRLKHVLASLGALITVLSLATDPFAQQIIRYYDCYQDIGIARASIPRSNFYAQQSGAIHTGANLESIGPGVQRSINAGVFAPVVTPDAVCTTGNCTWPNEYSTVGFCSSCEDLSDRLSFNNNTWTTHTHSGNQTYSFHYSNLTTSLPWGLESNSTLSGGGQQGYAAFGVPGTYDATGYPFATSVDFVLGKNVQGPLDPSTYSAWPQCTNAAANQTWPCRGYGASRCQLYPCIKTYKASETAGRLVETITDTSSQWADSLQNNAVGTLDTHCITGVERAALLKEGYKIGPNQRWLAYNVTFPWPVSKMNNTFPESLATKQCLYGFSITFLSSIPSFFSSVFSGEVTGLIQAPETPYGLFFGPQSLQSIFNFGDVDFQRMEDTFTNITESLTSFMRQNSDPGFARPAVGVARQEKTCIAVKWAWLTFPAFLVVLTLLFFVLMIVETRPTESRPAIWKSSPLGLLYYKVAGPDGQTPNLRGHGGMHDVNDMEAFARRTTVKLTSPTDEAARLEVKDGL